MNETEVKISFEKCLKFTYKVLLYSGLIHFKYSEREKKFKYSLFNYIVTQIIYGLLTTYYGILVWWWFAMLLANYVSFIESPDMGSNAILIQDSFLIYAVVFLRLMTTYLYALNCLKRRRCLLDIVNDMLDIFNRIKAHTDSLVYFNESLLWVAMLKICFTVIRVYREIYTFYPAAFILRDVFYPYSYLVCVLMGMTCVFFQLVLICFYMKMNEFLMGPCRRKTNREISRHLRQFIAISNHIHRVKKKLDWFYTMLFMGLYIGLISDVFQLYDVLRTMLYWSQTLHWIVKVVYLIIHFPFSVAVSFDIYFLGRLSDMLNEVEKKFKWLVWDLIDERSLHEHKHLERAVELMFHQNWLRDLCTLAFEKIQLDQQFAIEYFLKVIIINAITCLLFYASVEIYNAPQEAIPYGSGT